MKEKTISVRLELPEPIHAGAKSKAALARQRLKEWLVNLIAKASK